MKAGAKALAGKDLNQDVPLRGFVECGDCGNPPHFVLIRRQPGAKHLYYLCFNKDCDSDRESIRRDEVEGAFEARLKSLQPTRSLFSLVRTMLKDGWEHRLDQPLQL